MPELNKANRQVCDVDIRVLKTMAPFLKFDTANTTTAGLSGDSVYAMAKGSRNMYQNDYSMSFNGLSVLFETYNFLVDKYKKYNDNLKKITLPIVGYSSLISAYYNTIDFASYLQHSLMPTVEMSDTSSSIEVNKLTAVSLSPVAVIDIENISISTADNAVLAMAKTIIDPRYKVKISASSIDSGSQQGQRIWNGTFVVRNHSEENDTAASSSINVTINDDYSAYVKQKIQKFLNNNNTDDYSITGLFDKPYSEFVSELRKYSLNCLNAFYNSCQSCIDILIDQGIADKNTWSGQSPNLYNDLYLQYLDKLSAIESEIKLRQEEINSIIGTYDSNGELVNKGIQNFLDDEKDNIRNSLDLKEYLGTELWLEFCSFRREDVYSNDNYISDGLNNAELFERANDFFQAAQKDIYRSAELQHSITASLKNLLMIKEFSPIVNYFEVGNWLRIKIDDEVYKLRLTKYSINYNDTNDIPVEFSDAIKASSTISSVQEVIAQVNQTVYIKDWEFTEIPIFHFCNVKSENSLAVVGEFENGKIKSKVPNILLTEPYTILGFIYLEKTENSGSDNEEITSGRSVYTFQIPVRKKPKPQGYIFENDIEYVSYESLKAEMYESIDALMTADVGKFWKDSNGNIKGEYFNDYKNNIASGVFSHAEGSNTAAMGAYSHAGGEGTVASLSWQFATGKYNDYTDDTYAFMVGNGTSDAVRSNAMTVDWNGNLKANGDIIGTDVNGNPLSLRDIAEEFVRISDEIQDVVSLPIKYVLSDDGTLTVTGTGDIATTAIENKEKITTAEIDIDGEIGIGAFASCPNLGMATVNCNKICDKAFAGCTKLGNFTIDKSVKEIGSQALFGCGFNISIGLALFYSGTMAEWDAVIKADDWIGSTEYIKNGVITCSDGTVTI